MYDDMAVAGVAGAEPDASVDIADPAEPSQEELAIARELVRSAGAPGHDLDAHPPA
ncbi:hypothetical protein [Kribbella catacumbae]|uniref:hypothetical protein n=1 Tax=Kribbella catacumbae TaxID=460086 RepID=UPI00037BF6FA|nr:hypothetical protein [Kribbella catacumbae]